MKQENIDKLEEISALIRLYTDCCIELTKRIDDQELKIISLEIKQKRKEIINRIHSGIYTIMQFIPWIIIFILALLFYKFN